MTNAYGVSMYFPYKKASKVNTVSAINNDIGVDNEYNKCNNVISQNISKTLFSV